MFHVTDASLAVSQANLGDQEVCGETQCSLLCTLIYFTLRRLRQ